MIVIIVHWNAAAACARTVTRLRDQDVDAKILIVDNASTAAERAALPVGDDIEIIDAGRNAGFGAGANVGIRRWLQETDATWCALMPHDALPAAGTLAELERLGNANERCGLLSADVGDQMAPRIDRVLGPIPGPAGGSAGYETVDYPHGTLMLLRRACIEQIGLFDERFFAYNEEADLGIRAREAGWEVGLGRGVMVENPGQGGGGAVVDYLMLRNTITLVRENFGLRAAAWRVAIAVWQLVNGVLRPRTKAPWFDARARVLALRDSFRGRMGAPPDELRPAASG